MTWIALYDAATILCLRQALATAVASSAALLSAIAIVWAVLFFQSVIGDRSTASELLASLTMQTRAVKEAREIGGLLLVAAWMLTLWLSNRDTATQGLN